MTKAEIRLGRYCSSVLRNRKGMISRTIFQTDVEILYSVWGAPQSNAKTSGLPHGGWLLVYKARPFHVSRLYVGQTEPKMVSVI